MNQLGLWEPQGGVSCWCPESGLNKLRLRFRFMLLTSGTVLQKMWDRPQLCLNPGWKQFIQLSIWQLKVFYLHSELLIWLINDYFLYLWNDFICLLLVLCSCEALWITLSTNQALQINFLPYFCLRTSLISLHGSCSHSWWVDLL